MQHIHINLIVATRKAIMVYSQTQTHCLRKSYQRLAKPKGNQSQDYTKQCRLVLPCQSYPKAHTHIHIHPRSYPTTLNNLPPHNLSPHLTRPPPLQHPSGLLSRTLLLPDICYRIGATALTRVSWRQLLRGLRRTLHLHRHRLSRRSIHIDSCGSKMMTIAIRHPSRTRSRRDRRVVLLVRPRSCRAIKPICRAGRGDWRESAEVAAGLAVPKSHAGTLGGVHA